jgi:hypothetical protein
VTAPEVAHHVVAVHPGSELAIKDTNAGWQSIHRVRYVIQLSAQESCYVVACGLHIESSDEVLPLSSGYLLGRTCRFCWAHLTTEAVPA